MTTLVIGAAAWFLVGKDIYNDLQDDIAREDGGGPRSERIYRRSQFEPAVQALRDEVGPRALLLEISMRADRLEFHVRRGRGAAVYVSDDGDYDDLSKADSATVTVPASDAYPLRRVDPGAPQRIVERIEQLEGGGDFLTTQLRLIRDRGKVVWVANGRIGQRGVGYYANVKGRHVETATAYFTR